MALQIRRGTDAERQVIIPLQGELIFTTDTKRLYVGDGTTQGGIAVDIAGGGGGASVLNDLTDVNITSLTSGQVLKYNGTAWVNSSDNTGTTIDSINDIEDVVITSPTTGQVLKYNGTAWVNDSDLNDGTGVVELNDIVDISLITPTAGEVLKFDGTSWINEAVSFNELSNVNIDLPVSSEILKFDGVNWINSEEYTLGTDTNPVLGGNLDIGVFNIEGFGNIDISGSITSSTISSNVITVSPVSNPAESIFRIRSSTDNFLSPNIEFYKSRGTEASPTALSANDRVGGLLFKGHDGTEYRDSALMQVIARSNHSTGVNPSFLRIATANSSGVLTQAAVIDSDIALFAGDISARNFEWKDNYLKIGSLNPNLGFVVGTPPSIYVVENEYKFDSLVLAQSHSTADCSNISTVRTRGTNAAPLDVQNGDTLADFNFLGWAGGERIGGAAIRARVFGTVGTGAMPTELRFITRSFDNSFDTRVRISPDGLLQTNGMSSLVPNSTLQFFQMPALPSYANEAAAITAAGGAAAPNGSMYYDIGLGKIRGKAGGVWVDLH